MTHSPTLVTAPEQATPATLETYESVQDSPEFAELRRRFRRFVFPMTGLFLGWYVLYVLLADYAHGFMATKLWGNINVGLVMGFGQFVSTFIITFLYVRWSTNTMDPEADRLCALIEGEK